MLDGSKNNLLRARIVQPNVILYVQVAAPVANLRGPLIRSDLHDGQVVLKVNRYALLRVLEFCIRRRWNIVVRAIGDGRA